MNAKQNELSATMERQQKLMSGASDEIRRKVFQDVLVLENKISEWKMSWPKQVKT